jgi:hypothetical protein
MMRRLLVIAALAAGCIGCVERRMTLVTEPTGAIAYYNGREIGETPVTFNFTWYQAADISFVKDGYRSLRVVQPVKAPLYQRFPLDFFAEALLPFTLRDSHTFTFALEEETDADEGELLERAKAMRVKVSPGA